MVLKPLSLFVQQHIVDWCSTSYLLVALWSPWAYVDGRSGLLGIRFRSFIGHFQVKEKQVNAHAEKKYSTMRSSLLVTAARHQRGRACHVSYVIASQHGICIKSPQRSSPTTFPTNVTKSFHNQ